MTIPERIRESAAEIGGFVLLSGLLLYVVGPTILDPHGDGLWYGVTSLVGGLLVGYDVGRSTEADGQT